ncbi:MAG: helix-turn-helix domain-containing protein [Nanoarchaeota archaeon]
MDIKTLQTIDLTEGEAKVYLALLKTGSTTTGSLISSSGVSRSKVYDVLERLKQKGLVTEVTKENTRYFEGSDPKRIIDYLESKKRDISEKIEDSKKIVFDLNKLKNSELEKQEAKVYTGIEGLRTIYNEILDELSKGGEYLAFGMGDLEISSPKVKELIHKFHLQREERKIAARVIVHERVLKDIKEFEKLKYYKLKSSKLNFPTAIAIIKDKVLTLVAGKEIIAFVIQSKQVSKKYKDYFEELWEI